MIWWHRWNKSSLQIIFRNCAEPPWIKNGMSPKLIWESRQISEYFWQYSVLLSRLYIKWNLYKQTFVWFFDFLSIWQHKTGLPSCSVQVKQSKTMSSCLLLNTEQKCYQKTTRCFNNPCHLVCAFAQNWFIIHTLCSHLHVELKE